MIRPKGYWLRRYRRLRAWRCRECGCTFKQAQAKRRRRGEGEIPDYPALGARAPRGCQAYLKKRWKLFSEQHHIGEAYPDQRRREGP